MLNDLQLDEVVHDSLFQLLGSVSFLSSNMLYVLLFLYCLLLLSCMWGYVCLEHANYVRICRSDA